MRIAYFTDTFLPTVNGVATSLATMSQYMGEKGNQVKIYAPSSRNDNNFIWEALNTEIFKFKSLPSSIYPDLRTSFLLDPKFVYDYAQFNPDIIHVHSPYFLGLMGVLVGKITGKPMIGTFHTYFMEPEYLELARIKKATQIFSKSVWKTMEVFYNRFDIVTTPSIQCKQDLERKSFKKQIVVIPNSLDEKKIVRVSSNNLRSLKSQYGISGKTILYIGRVSVEKSIDILIKSFSIALKKHPDVTLVIVGSGPSLDSLKKLSKTLGINNKVVFVGEIPNKDLLTKGYYQLGDIFATCSTTEVLPVSVIEALCFKLPIVGVDKRGVGEILNGVGLLAPSNNPEKFAEKMLSLIEDKYKREELSAKSYQTFKQKYSLEKVGNEYTNLYSKLISEKSV